MESAAAAHRRPAATAFLAEPHLMWRQIFNSYSQTTMPSWDQETAFAQDTAESAVWPPRSYTCNFCMRQFRSAQALGGHMNVHRRDRARLQNDPGRPFRPPRACPIIKGGSFNGDEDDNDFYNNCVKNNKRSKVCVSSLLSGSSSLDQELDLELKLGF